MGWRNPKDHNQLRNLFKAYKDGVKGIGHVGLGNVASSQEMTQRLQEVARMHWLIVVEVVISWLNLNFSTYNFFLQVCDL